MFARVRARVCVQVRGKVNAITMDKCTRTGLLFDQGKPPATGLCACVPSQQTAGAVNACAVHAPNMLSSKPWPSCVSARGPGAPSALCTPCPAAAVVATCEPVSFVPSFTSAPDSLCPQRCAPPFPVMQWWPPASW